MNIKILTYNIQHGLDYIELLNKNRLINLDKIVNVIKKYNPDIIGLNEVYNDINNIVSVEQTEYIANKLGYKYYYFGKSITIKETIGYGNAIISKYPLENIKLHAIEDPITKDENVHYETRSIIQCDVAINDYKINTLITHLGLAKSEQLNGVNKILSLIDNQNNKTILMGDFNMEENNDNIKKISKILENTIIKNNNNENVLTYPSINPNIKIDYIFIKELKLVNAKVLNEIASDHLPVLSTIEL